MTKKGSSKKNFLQSFLSSLDKHDTSFASHVIFLIAMMNVEIKGDEFFFYMEMPVIEIDIYAVYMIALILFSMKTF